MTHLPIVRRAVVVGGGIGGLTAAYRLLKKSQANHDPIDITLIEASQRLGGVVHTINEDGFIFDTGPDCFISEKPGALKLSQDLGLEEELIGTNPEYRQSFILKRGRLVKVPKGLYLMAPQSITNFVFSSLVSWKGKLRALGDLFIPPVRSDCDESLASFVQRRLGSEILERVAQPMIAGIYTSDARSLSLKATMPRFLELEQKYGSVIRGLRKQHKNSEASGPRYSLFMSFKKGMSTLSSALEKNLGGIQIRTGTPVKKITRTPSGQWNVELKAGESITAELLFLAVPTHWAAFFLKDEAPALSELLEEIQYASTGVINLVYREDQIGHPLNGMGFVIPEKEQKSLIACSFTHRKFSGRAPAGYALLRAFVGGAMHEDFLAKDDVEMIEAVHQDLSQILKIQGNAVKAYVTRWDKSMAQYTLGHLGRVYLIDKELKSLPNLFLIGNGYRGIGIPDVISSADQAIETSLQR